MFVPLNPLLIRVLHSLPCDLLQECLLGMIGEVNKLWSGLTETVAV